MVIPQTNIYLLKCPLEIDNNHQLNFSNKQTQFNYFNSLPKIGGGEYLYQRENNIIRFPSIIDDIYEYNYVMYQNDSYNDKWFYAYITSMKYENDSVTLVSITTDSFQTWMFDIRYMKSFVKREHVNNDLVGLHTIPEELETGEYIVNDYNINKELQSTVIIVASTVVLTNNDFSDNGGGYYNGIYTGYKYYKYSNNNDGIVALQNTLVALEIANKTDAIGSIFLAYTRFAVPEDISNGSEIIQSFSTNNFTWGNDSGDRYNLKPTNLNGYIPKNNKLFTYPYCYLNLTNNNGSNAIYHYEKFSGTSICDFDIYGCCSVGGSGLIVPINYNGTANNYSEALQLAKLPVCGWYSDSFTNWLTQNAVNVPAQLAESIAGGILGTAGGIKIANVSKLLGAAQVGASVTSMVSGIAENLYSVHVHSLEPPQARGNVNTGDVSMASKNSTITAYQMTIKQEYAKIIDSFFSFFGYKVNDFKIPNINGRENWNYVETESINIIGNIPQTDINNIKQMFDTGVTIWHNPNNFLNYNSSNNII